MSTKIQLRFETFQNPELETKIENVGKLTRLFCSMKFKQNLGRAGYLWHKSKKGMFNFHSRLEYQKKINANPCESVSYAFLDAD